MNKKIQKGLEELVDICGGKMTLKELTQEIERTYLFRNPEYTVITIERDDKIQGMRCTIYMQHKDFERYGLK